MEEMSIRARIVKALGETNEAEFAQIIEGIHPADMAEVLETFVRRSNVRLSLRKSILNWPQISLLNLMRRNVVSW